MSKKRMTRKGELATLEPTEIAILRSVATEAKSYMSSGLKTSDSWCYEHGTSRCNPDSCAGTRLMNAIERAEDAGFL